MSTQSSPLRRLFGRIWVALEWLRRIVLMLVFIGALAIVVIVLRGGPPIKVGDNVALVVMPSGVIVDMDDSDPRQQLAQDLLGEEPDQTVLGDMLDAIHAAATDDRISMLFLKLDLGFAAGQAQLEELADAITRFRDSGKKVIAYGAQLGQDEYYLAAHADEIVIDPMGLVFLTGFDSYRLYLKEALDKLGVTINVFRVGEYKSAVEPLIRQDMSDEARADAKRWLDSLWSGWLEEVSQARGVDRAELQSYINRYPDMLAAVDGDTAELARQAGLVDQLMTLDQVREHAGASVGMDADHGSFRQVYFLNYLRALDQHSPRQAQAPKPAIALAYAQGEIVDGRGEPGLVGGEDLAERLREARDDKDVKAVVLRIDSPGGSVFASEQIRQALLSVKAAGKPVVVSMGNVAASGGYWIAMDADRILAHASTITGSIGVFGVLPTFENVADKLGVASDGVGTTEWSGAFSAVRPLLPHARRTLQSIVEHDYQLFIGHVADARHMSVESADEIARGRIWSGNQAMGVGLVDEIGDMDQAIGHAAKLAELPEDGYRLKPLLPPFDLPSFLLERLPSLGSAQAAWLGPLLETWRSASAQLERWNDPRGVYAHCLCGPRAGATAPGR